MNEQQIENLTYITLDLDRLADSKVLLANLQKERHEAIQNAIPLVYRETIADIEADYDVKMAGVMLAINATSEDIKQDVLEHGATVQGEHLMAVWNKGRVSWDTAALKGYAVTHPEVNQLRKTGKPSVTIRNVK